MARMPVQHGLGFRDRWQMIGGDKTLYSDRAKVRHVQIIARLQRLCSLRRKAVAETRRSVEQAKKYGFGRRTECLSLRQCEQRLVERRASLHHDPFAPDHIGSRIGNTGKCANGNVIGSKLRSPLYAAAGVSETGLGAEIGTRGHAGGKLAGKSYWDTTPSGAVSILNAAANSARV
jgi:hypothetical protein